MLPVFIDANEDPEINLEESCFKPIWKVLNALKAHDDILAEELDYLRLELGRRTYRHPPKLGKISIDLPVSIGTAFSDSLKLKIVDRCSSTWEFYYGLLLRYIEEFGKAPTNTELEYCNYNLGSWISIQRKSFNKNELKASYISRLEALPGWVWDALEAYWQQGFDNLKEFFQSHGHLNVSFNHCIDGFNLSSWMSVQRRTFKKKKMSPERQLKLESIPEWSWQVFDALWEKGLSILLAFYEREKHINITPHYSEQNLKLGTWIRNRKKDYELGKLPLEKQKRLESIPGWTWESDLDASWNNAFRLLQKYSKETGHSKFPRGHKYEGFNLDVWVSTQRRAHLLGKLPPARKAQLESLPGWLWNVVKQRDEIAFQSIDSFVKREGHAFIPTTHVENTFPLGKWVSQHRLYYTQGNLEEEIKVRLESYPGWFWNANEGYWEKGKAFVMQFCKREGHSLIKNSHFEGDFELGKWVQMHRYQYNKQTLTQDKIDFFNALPNWSWDVKADQWKAGMHCLTKYVEREGHSGVPAGHIENGFTLGTRVSTQRYAYSQNKLSREKIKLLESLPEWCWDKIEFEWQKGYNYLQQFVSLYGHANAPAKYKSSGFSLGIWIQSQRSNYKLSKISLDRIALLEGLEGWIWDPKEAKWEESYKELLCFYVREGHLKVPYNHIENECNLTEWISSQRKAYKEKKISLNRIVKLESVKGWLWDTRKPTNSKTDS